MKYLGTNVTTCTQLYEEIYKTLMKEFKDLNRYSMFLD